MPGTYQYDVEIKSNVAKLLSDMKQVQDRLDTVEGKEYKIKLNVDEKKLSSVISNLEKMLDSLGKGTGDFKQFENLSKELSSIVSEVQSLSKAFGKVDDSGAKTLLSSIQNIDKSLSELSQNILNVNKNMSNMGGNTSGAVKQVENITNESKKAASALEDVAKAQEKVNGQKTNISSDISSQVKVSNGITDQIVANEKKKQEAYKATTETVMYHAGVISKLNKAETNGRFYGSDRGTGYFGTGHYFVDSNTKHELDNNSSYSSLPYTSIDISKYDNLFKATSDEVADALHTFLKSLTKFTQGSDSFEVSELFSQFQKVFGETTMDMQEFDAKLSQLKAYMQSSNMSDRGDSVSTQFMKSLGYGGVDTRGTKYADTRYGTVIYDLKEESVLQANITDELQKQGQMLEKITYEKGQVFDKSEDTRIQGILDQQAKAKEIETEFNKIFDSTNLNTYNSELDSVNQKLTENESIINNCKSAIETADEDAKRFAKEMAEFDLHMSDEEIAETANKNKVEYQERIEELSKEQSLLKDRKQEIESNLDAEYKLANAARERATATVEDRMKDAFPKTSENLEQVAQSEQKVQQEAVAIDKAFDNISFTPNTEGFEDIIAKFGILREQAEQITKIVKTTKQTADGTPNISYKATLKNGSSYYLGENSTPQVLNASETVYDAKVDNAKKLEREKQIWNELTNSLERYATIQKRIANNNALSTDNEEATKLLEHIHELQRNDILPTEKLTASNEKLQQINQTVTDLKAKLKESTLDSLQGSIDKYQKIYNQRRTYSSDFTPSEQYTKNLTELNTAIKNLIEYRNTLKNVSEVTAEQEAELKGLVTACEKASDSFKSLSASEKGASQIAVDKLVQRINKDLDECTNYSKEAKLGLRALRDELESANPRNLKEITSEIINIENAEIRAGRAGRSFFDTLKNSGFHQLAAQMAGMFGFYDVINLGKEAISTIVSLDDALVDLKKTTAMSKTQLEDFYYDANDVAKQMGVTTEEIITQASAWSRLGYSSQEAATTMAKLSSKFASISPGMSTDEAQEGLVSIMKAFDIDPDDVETEIMDKVNVLGNKFAEENQDVIEGLKRSAAAMSAMGQSFTDTAALFTGGMEILQDSESMGTALRTLSMRVRGYDEETNQLSDDLVNVTGEVADLTKTAQDSQGVSLFTDATQEHYRSMVEYLGDIADRWDQISEKNQTELLQKLFGKNRANAGAAIIQNFDQVRAAIEAMDESAGSSEAEMSAIESSLSYKINALKETWVGCVQDMIDRGDLGTIVTGLTKVSEAITFLLDKFGILGTIGLGAGIFSGIKNVGRDKMYSLSF